MCLKQSVLSESGYHKKWLTEDSLYMEKFAPKCYKFLEEINKLYSEEVLNYIFMPVNCDTFYAGKLFLRVITVWVTGYFLKLIVMVTGIKQMSLFGFGTCSAEMQVT